MELVEKWLEEENQLIDDLEVRLEQMLASFMDQAMENFEAQHQFTELGTAAISQMVDTLSIGWTNAVAFGAERQQSLLVKQDGLTVRAVAEYVREYGLSRTRQVVSTTTRQLHQMILRGQRDGLTTAEITAQVINEIPRMAATRAKIIAETEIHSAAQFGSYNAALRSGKLLNKIWNTVGDARVRDFGNNAQFSHRLMQGVKSPLDIPFKIPHYTGTVETIRFPGDPEGSAGNIINCRCIMTYEEK